MMPRTRFTSCRVWAWSMAFFADSATTRSNATRNCSSRRRSSPPSTVERRLARSFGDGGSAACRHEVAATLCPAIPGPATARWTVSGCVGREETMPTLRLCRGHKKSAPLRLLPQDSARLRGINLVRGPGGLPLPNGLRQEPDPYVQRCGHLRVLHVVMGRPDPNRATLSHLVIPPRLTPAHPWDATGQNDSGSPISTPGRLGTPQGKPGSSRTPRWGTHVPPQGPQGNHTSYCRGRTKEKQKAPPAFDRPKVRSVVPWIWEYMQACLRKEECKSEDQCVYHRRVERWINLLDDPDPRGRAFQDTNHRPPSRH